MKIVIYGPERRTGVLLDDDVVDISGAVAKYLRDRENENNPVALAAVLAPSELGQLIEAGDRALDITKKAVEHLFDDAGDQIGANGEQLVFPASDVTLHAPRPRGARVACAGGNYAEHAAAMAERAIERGEDRVMEGGPRDYVRSRGMWGFWKIDRESVGQDGDLIYPARAIRLDYEGELAIVFGKQGKNIKAEDASDYIWGITLLGDWSIRISPEGGPLKFAMQKNFDTSCSIGPCILVSDDDPAEIVLETLVNGELRQKFRVGDMVYSFGDYMEFLSRDFTFYPGDMISGGTGAGTAGDSSPTLEDGKPAPERFLKPGDVVEIRAPEIGTLRTHVVAGDVP